MPMSCVGCDVRLVIRAHLGNFSETADVTVVFVLYRTS